MSQPARESVKLRLDDELLSLADELKINLTLAAEEGIRQAVKAERERLWRIENADAIAACNEYVEQNGLPLAKYRQF
ncbi:MULTISPECIES: type II toxin-antitoxin system CcdA family antitoxin [unclassified Rhizobium]|uniref:type II toxin-antitoxin system CcdA family antitoxin n=1 Tax=unclassified Rhizobium TaxID=2613769 RepID=UPI0007156965|nr:MULTISPECIES: type II toxin-antitoxin system CcdA family antitoxin [unclassified Rhizobium]KQS87911.1 post-segregation antitoxin CcdA [Rhizobium sp. Leaf386]KQS94533.1 post-segregation antitoxin CcdA [Rhizobium sp. Leaf391]KQU01539.1 post-segregation antitoxin CcdA [Rhizobium sp. Leaf453]